MIKYLVVCIIIHTFAKNHTVECGKGRENCQQINITMKIQEIKEALLGRRIRHYNSFTGTLTVFKISIVAEVVHAICLYSPEKNNRIYISKDNIKTLLSEGYYSRKIVGVDGTCIEEWQLN